MWGVNGEYAFRRRGGRRDAGRSAVDVFGPTPEFDEKAKSAHSTGAVRPGRHLQRRDDSADRRVDVVFCAGVLYHHPSPFDVLVALQPDLPRDADPAHVDDPEVRGPAERRGVLPDARSSVAATLWNLKRARRAAPGRHHQPVPAAGRLRQLVLGPDAELSRVAAWNRRIQDRVTRDAKPLRRRSCAPPSARRSITSFPARRRPRRLRRRSPLLGLRNPRERRRLVFSQVVREVSTARGDQRQLRLARGMMPQPARMIAGQDQ